MRLWVRALRLVAVSSLLVALAAPAFGAEPAPPLADADVTDVQVWPGTETGRNVIVVGVTVPEGTKLPARVRVPVPPLGQIVWAGEILGGDPSQDPERDFEIVNGAGATVAEMVIEKGRTAQIEAYGEQISRKSDISSVTAEWVQAVPSKITGFSVRLPAGSADVSIEPSPQGAPQVNEVGESLYSLPSRNMKTGENLVVKVTWKTVPVAKPTTAGGGATNPIPVIVGLLAAAVVALIVVLFWNRGRGVGAEADEEAEETEAETEDRSTRRAGAATEGASDLEDESAFTVDE